jgi:dipeptidyl aminopeptidase/acylaminoacyl peptidase
MWSFQRVGVPVPSPDGKWVVFSVNEVTYDPAKDVSDLWIVPTDGSSAPRRLTSNKAAESGPAWSADSTKLAFGAKRDDDEVAQIYVLDVAVGGEAQRTTSAPTAASAPKWSPDGKRIVFQAAMWPGATDEDSNRKAAQDKKNAKSKVRVYETFPIRNFDRWIDESKTHLWIVDVGGDRKSRSLFARWTSRVQRRRPGRQLDARRPVHCVFRGGQVGRGRSRDGGVVAVAGAGGGGRTGAARS